MKKGFFCLLLVLYIFAFSTTTFASDKETIMQYRISEDYEAGTESSSYPIEFADIWNVITFPMGIFVFSYGIYIIIKRVKNEH